MRRKHAPNFPVYCLRLELRRVRDITPYSTSSSSVTVRPLPGQSLLGSRLRWQTWTPRIQLRALIGGSCHVKT
eukprot:104-Pyramimonas_sp.AAC.1